MKANNLTGASILTGAFLLSGFLFLAFAVSAAGQTTNAVQIGAGALTVIGLGPNYRICAGTNNISNSSLTGVSAKGIAHSPNRVEIATGMNYLNPGTGQFEASSPQFTLSPDGTAFTANRVQHKVHLNADIYGQSAVTISFSGLELNATPSAIGIYDAADGSSAIIGTITNSTGVQISTNQVLFSDAFSGICGSVVFTVEAGTFHQDILFTGRLNPTDWGFSTNDPLRIQIYTEFFGQIPEPDVLVQPVYVEGNPAVRNRMVSPDLMDQTIGFGNLVFGMGRAYTPPTPANPSGAGGIWVRGPLL